MASKVQLPPYPANAPPGGFVWTDWWKKFQDFVQDITDIAGSGSSTNFSLTGVSPNNAIISRQLRWCVVANFLMFQARLTFRDTTDPIVFSQAQIGFINGGTALMPVPVMDGAFSVAAFGAPGAPVVRSLGNGIVHGNEALYLPDFTIAEGSSIYEWVGISGHYFVS